MMKTKQTTLTMMCGLPRCGKSSWIKKNKGDAVIVSLDEIRSQIFGHQFHREAEDFIIGMAKSMVNLLITQGKDVIIDATNIKNSFRHTWINIATKYNAKVRIVWIKTSVKECLKRNTINKDGKSVPENVITGMAAVFENPISIEPDIEVIEIKNNKQLKTSKVITLINDNYYSE